LEGGTCAIFIRRRCGRICGTARGGSAAGASGDHDGCGRASGGGAGASGSDALDLVLDGLVECAGHAFKREHGGEGEVGVGTVLERDRGEADEVGFPVFTHGRVDDKVDAGSCCDVDRVRVSNWLEETLLGLAANVEGDSAVALLSEGYTLAVVLPFHTAGLATSAGGRDGGQGYSQFAEGWNGKSRDGSDEGGETHIEGVLKGVVGGSCNDR